MTTEEDMKPSEFYLKANTGILESLGHNMYTSVAKSLVEFVANGFDAEATEVKLNIPFQDIEKARDDYIKTLRQNKQQGQTALELVQSTISPNIEITIEDNGHGMDYRDIRDKFMPINRNRRKDSGNKSLNGKRFVMGRKGLGKLAGFGIAELITIKTKVKGTNYSTKFVMDANEIKKYDSITDVKIPASYEPANSEEHYTKITLSHLRSDALKSQQQEIIDELNRNFHIVKDEFHIALNNKQIEENDITYDFIYPKELNEDGYCEENLDIDQLGSIPIKYVVKFRSVEKNNGHKLLADYKGARIFCNGRLALGPSLLKLKPGAHTFHAQNNMECIVHVDELDRNINFDFINTNRTSLKYDNEVVAQLIDRISKVMECAIEEYNNYRTNKIENDLEQDDFSKGILSMTEHLGKKNKDAAKKLLKIVALTHGLKSETYKQIAPLLIQSVNAGEVLTKLVNLAKDPQDINNILHEFNELREIENNDVIKLYRGRRNGIDALNKLIQKGDELWKKKQFENEIHQLLKENPWLIHAEYSRYISSNETFDTLLKRLNNEMKIDNCIDTTDKRFDDDRPDLVFLISSTEYHNIVIVELKSPALPLNNNHLIQLEKYIMKTKAYIKQELPRIDSKVTGYLIGSMPDINTTNDDEKLLIDRMKSHRDCEVLSLQDLVERAKISHIQTLEVLENIESKNNE